MEEGLDTSPASCEALISVDIGEYHSPKRAHGFQLFSVAMQEVPQPNDTAAAFRNLHLERGFSLETSSSSSSSDDDELSALQRPAVVRSRFLGVNQWACYCHCLSLGVLLLTPGSPFLHPPCSDLQGCIESIKSGQIRCNFVLAMDLPSKHSLLEIRVTSSLSTPYKAHTPCTAFLQK